MNQFKEGRALLIGIGEYAEADLDQLALTVNEAQDIGDALRDPNVAGYERDRVRVMCNAEAKRGAVVTALEELAASTKPRDMVFLYLASHGDLGEDGEYYFATYDVQLTPSRTIVKDSGLSATRLRELLGKIQAQKLLVLINTCFSGEVTGTLSPKGGTPPSKAFDYQLLATGRGRAIITASRSTQPSVFAKTGQTYTYFGQAVLDALHGKDISSHSGYIGLFEFYSAIYDDVMKVLKGTPYAQEPELTLSKAVGAFPIALHQGGKLGALNATTIQQTLPERKAVDSVGAQVIEAIRQTIIQSAGANIVQATGPGAQAIGGDLNQGVNFGERNTFNNVTFGDIAGRDIIKTTTTIAAAAAATNQTKLLEEIEELSQQLKNLDDVPIDKRSKVKAAASDLAVATDSGKDGDKATLLERLTSAQSIMIALTGSVPAALKLGEAIGTMVQRALVLWT